MTNKKKKKNPSKHQDKIERDKNLLMVAGVSFFMTLIVVLWFFNIQNVLQTNSVQGQADKNDKMEELETELGSTWQKIDEQIDKLKEKNLVSTSTEVGGATTSPQKVAGQATTTSATTSREYSSTSTPRSPQTATTSEQLQNLKQKIEKEIQ